jgi:hypothetical protein
MQKKINESFGSNRIFFIRIIIRVKTAKSGYPKKKKISGSIRIDPDTDRSTRPMSDKEIFGNLLDAMSGGTDTVSKNLI